MQLIMKKMKKSYFTYLGTKLRDKGDEMFSLYKDKTCAHTTVQLLRLALYSFLNCTQSDKTVQAFKYYYELETIMGDRHTSSPLCLSESSTIQTMAVPPTTSSLSPASSLSQTSAAAPLLSPQPVLSGIPDVNDYLNNNHLPSCDGSQQQQQSTDASSSPSSSVHLLLFQCLVLLSPFLVLGVVSSNELKLFFSAHYFFLTLGSWKEVLYCFLSKVNCSMSEVVMPLNGPCRL
ncbi:hypothetical protein BDA99DRAFT_533468 [Phascolomyces articulosus]|uniref:Uncharacterized protein n=1 Tax=Phascolomyces articulosus TaxID=60185 RepID=A0AAD5K718_9FUNG|nr:hypothetical protein BDA99DRAFT_533468 [Phascolomyces articulosus]